MTEQQLQSKFEGWAIVEMMGHQREIGYVTTEYFGAAALFRVDSPEIPERDFTLTRPEYLHSNEGYRQLPAGATVRRAPIPPKSRLVSPGSLYAITPCTEETARKAIEESVPRALIVLDIPSRSKSLPEPETEDDSHDDDNWNGECGECGAVLGEDHKEGCSRS